jgi:hypothetical protein
VGTEWPQDVYSVLRQVSLDATRAARGAAHVPGQRLVDPAALNRRSSPDAVNDLIRDDRFRERHDLNLPLREEMNRHASIQLLVRQVFRERGTFFLFGGAGQSDEIEAAREQFEDPAAVVTFAGEIGGRASELHTSQPCVCPSAAPSSPC